MAAFWKLKKKSYRHYLVRKQNIIHEKKNLCEYQRKLGNDKTSNKLAFGDRWRGKPLGIALFLISRNQSKLVNMLREGEETKDVDVSG